MYAFGSKRLTNNYKIARVSVLRWNSTGCIFELAGYSIGKAIKYNVNQWHKLIRYVEDGHLGIDNNITERDIRPFTTGRKNWLFSKSINGAQASATLYSIVMTCRANDINPYYYFQHLFKILPARQSDDDDFTDLMPWNVQLDFDYS